MVNVNGDEENFSEEISLQNDKHDDSIDLELIRQYDENKLLFLGHL